VRRALSRRRPVPAGDGRGLAACAPSRFVLTSVSPDNRNPTCSLTQSASGMTLLSLRPSRRVDTTSPNDIGMLIHESMSGQMLHRAQSKAGTLFETRAVVTPRGDYLVMIPDGQHANSPRDDANSLLGYRSSDQGKTWSGPFSPFGDQSKHHGGLPLIPKGGERIYVFETQRGALAKPATGDKAVAFALRMTTAARGRRCSWSTLPMGSILAVSAVIQMTETDAGTWMSVPPWQGGPTAPATTCGRRIRSAKSRRLCRLSLAWRGRRAAFQRRKSARLPSESAANRRDASTDRRTARTARSKSSLVARPIAEQRIASSRGEFACWPSGIITR